MILASKASEGYELELSEEVSDLTTKYEILIKDHFVLLQCAIRKD
jgi:hypothetical protein